MVEFKRILFPVHLSELSPKVAPYVCAVAQKFDAEIHLLHVAREFNHYIGVYVVEDSETRLKKLVNNLEQEISSGANERLLEFKKKYFKSISKIKSSVVSGNIYEEILGYAESERIDLIIMGTSRKKLADRFIFGAVAEKIAKLSVIPVMFIKHTELEP